MKKFKLALFASIMTLFIAVIFLIIVIYNFNNKEIEKNISSYPKDAVSIPQNFPISYNTDGKTHYIREDGLYEFDYSNKFKLARDKNGTQILRSVEHWEVENFGPQISIYSVPRLNRELLDLIDGILDYILVGEIEVNGLKGLIYKQTIDKYEDIYYTIKNDNVFVTLAFRRWTNFENNYQDLSYLNSEVMDIVNSIVIY